MRLGEADNPGILTRLRRISARSQSTNRFEILSSDDESVVRSRRSGAIRAAHSEDIGGPRSHPRGVGIAVTTQVDSDTNADDERLSSVPEDVVDALEADLAVDDAGGPVEVLTDEAPEEFEGRLQMGRRVVLVPQSADGTPRSHHNDSSSSKRTHLTGTARALQLQAR